MPGRNSPRLLTSGPCLLIIEMHSGRTSGIHTRSYDQMLYLMLYLVTHQASGGVG